MKTTSQQILALKEGEVLLHRVRKVAKRNAQGQQMPDQFKMSLEFVASIKLPNQTVSALSILNKGDERFAKSGKVIYGYMIAEPEVACELLGLDINAFNQLEISTGLPSIEWIERLHVITVDILNPMINGARVFVQQLETTIPPSSDSTPLVNPSTGELVLSKTGKPIFTNHRVVLADEPSNVIHIAIERMSKAEYQEMLMRNPSQFEVVA